MHDMYSNENTHTHTHIYIYIYICVYIYIHIYIYITPKRSLALQATTLVSFKPFHDTGVAAPANYGSSPSEVRAKVFIV